MAFDVFLLLWASDMVFLLLMLYFAIAIVVNHVKTAVRCSVCRDCHSCYCRIAFRVIVVAAAVVFRLHSEQRTC